MKKNYLIILLFLPLFTYCQNTTMTEYLYMTKGLKIQIESGLDTKKGYKLEKLGVIDEEKYSFVYGCLVRENNEENFAGVLVIIKSKLYNKQYYKAIPTQYFSSKKDSEVMLKFKKDLSNWDERMIEAYAKASSKMLSAVLMSSMTMLKEKKIALKNEKE